MTALPVARPESDPEEVAAMVRVSEDVHANSVVTSLVEPSLKVAIAFNWVVLPMATAACPGTMATEVATAAEAGVAVALAATVVSAAGAACGTTSEERFFAVGCLTTEPEV